MMWKTNIIFYMLIIIIFPQYIFADNSEEYLVLSQNEISIKETSEIVISGKINDYTRGTVILITIQKPNGEKDEFNVFGTKDGVFSTIMNFPQSSMLGNYKIELYYKETKIGTAFLYLKDIAEVERELISPWFKDVASLWNKKLISDGNYAMALEWMIKNELIKGFDFGDNEDKIEENTNLILPNWIKDSTQRWISGNMEDADYVNTVGFLVKEGFIDIPSAEVKFQFENPVLDTPDRIELTVGEIPQQIGNVRIVEENNSTPYFIGSLIGNWLLFHDGAYIEIEGEGYVMIRWEVESWMREGEINTPIIKGDLTYLGEEQTQEIVEIDGFNNKFYKLDGNAKIENTEGIGGTYNLGISVLSEETVLEMTLIKNENKWSKVIKN